MAVELRKTDSVTCPTCKQDDWAYKMFGYVCKWCNYFLDDQSYRYRAWDKIIEENERSINGK